MFGRTGADGGARARPRRGRRVLRKFALGILVIACLAAIGALGLKSAGVASQVQAFMGAARPWLYTAQLLCTAVVWARWQWIVRWLARKGRIGASAVEPLLRARHRLMTLVLLLQLTVGMGLPFSLLGSSTGR